MKRATLVESGVFAAVGAAGMAEGWRLSKDPQFLNQMMGPGSYVFVLSAALLATAAFQLVLDSRRPGGEGKAVGGAEKGRVAGIVALLCANVFLIELAGYPAALAVFFLVAFRILQVKSWRTNIILSLSITAVYYVVFVQFCGVIFPRGTLLPG